MSQTLSSYLIAVILALGVPLTGALVFAATHLATWLKAKVKSQQISDILVRLDDHVEAAVQSLLAKALADVQTGGLTKATLAQLKVDAVAAVKGYWGPAGLSQIEQVLGMSPDQVTNLITGKVGAQAAPAPAAAAVIVPFGGVVAAPTASPNVSAT